jgi:hypothetical protein
MLAQLSRGHRKLTPCKLLKLRWWEERSSQSQTHEAVRLVLSSDRRLQDNLEATPLGSLSFFLLKGNGIGNYPANRRDGGAMGGGP